jgi:hypothetical protein
MVEYPSFMTQQAIVAERKEPRAKEKAPTTIS